MRPRGGSGKTQPPPQRTESDALTRRPEAAFATGRRRAALWGARKRSCACAPPGRGVEERAEQGTPRGRQVWVAPEGPSRAVAPAAAGLRASLSSAAAGRGGSPGSGTRRWSQAPPRRLPEVHLTVEAAQRCGAPSLGWPSALRESHHGLAPSTSVITGAEVRLHPLLGETEGRRPNLRSGQARAYVLIAD